MAKAKSDLADAIYRRHGGLSRRESARIIGLIFGRIRRALADGKPVLISGFGTFKVANRGPRLGRNPRTGQPVLIGAARRLVFRPSRLVVGDLNRERPGSGRDDG
jgi:integration host factor subunit alpha